MGLCQWWQPTVHLLASGRQDLAPLGKQSMERPGRCGQWSVAQPRAEVGLGFLPASSRPPFQLSSKESQGMLLLR